MPRWVVPAVGVFWVGFLAAIAIRFFWGRLHGLFVLVTISVFLSLAVEPGVNRLARRGWRRGSATALILFGVLGVFLVFVAAIGTLVASQIADLLSNSEDYITDAITTINDTFGTNLDASEIIADFNDPDGAVQEFINDQQANAVNLSVAALGVLLQLFSVLLFTFYLVADGPKMRRGDLQPPDPGAPGAGAADVGAGRRQDRRLPLLAGPARPDLDGVPLDRVPVGRDGRAASRSPCGSVSSASSCPSSARTSPACCPSS